MKYLYTNTNMQYTMFAGEMVSKCVCSDAGPTPSPNLIVWMLIIMYTDLHPQMLSDCQHVMEMIILLYVGTEAG